MYRSMQGVMSSSVIKSNLVFYCVHNEVIVGNTFQVKKDIFTSTSDTAGRENIIL